MVFLSLQDDREQVHLEFTHDELYAFYNQVRGLYLLILLVMSMCCFLKHLPVCPRNSEFIYCLFVCFFPVGDHSEST